MRPAQREGMVRSLLREKQAPPVPLSRDDGERALQELEARRGGAVAPRILAGRVRQAEGTFSSEEAETRRRRLGECFRLPAQAIKEAFFEAYQWHVLPELASDDPDLLPKAQALERLLEEAALPSQIRKSVVAGTDERGAASEEEHQASAAHRAEISATFSYLNFVRWLCGLPKVSFSASKQSACRVISEALLPRALETMKVQRRASVTSPPEIAPKAKPRAKKTRPGSEAPASPPVQLAQALADIAHQDAVSILQGEGSLVSAVEQSLAAFRCSTGSQASGLGLMATDYRSLAPVADDVEFPPALQRFKVLWDLEAAEANMQSPSVAHREASEAKAPPRKLRQQESRAKRSEMEASYGVDSVWGDRKGTLAARRRLLNPALRSFAAARSDDVCILWTGRAGCVEALEEPTGSEVPAKASELDAVSYPPAGLVPLTLVEGVSVPWTVMPDATRFQPTSDTTVCIWQVQLQREDDVLVSAVRRRQVRVLRVVVDCSNHGESFCVIFWPDIKAEPGLQLEVVVSGLCGEKEQVTNFHEFISFRRKAADEALSREAANVREIFLQAGPLWRRSLSEEESNSMRTSDLVQPLGQRGKEIVTNSNDLIFTLCCNAVTLWPVLSAKRFDGDYSQVPRACQVIHLADRTSLVHVKLPLPSTTYQLQFSASDKETPRQVQQQPLWYTVRTTGQCQSLLRSIDDRMISKFGFVKTELETQLSGVTILAPLQYRVLVGQVYFLVYVDQSVALSAAREALPLHKASEEEESGPSIFSSRLLPKEPSSSREVRKMHQVLQEGLAKHTQVSSGDIHLDLMLHNGQHVHSLRERHDFPGVFESLLTISELDASTKIQMVLRFPRIHACDFSPRKVAEWLVTRG